MLKTKPSAKNATSFDKKGRVESKPPKKPKQHNAQAMRLLKPKTQNHKDTSVIFLFRKNKILRLITPKLKGKIPNKA